MIVKPLAYIATAAAIGVAVWVVMGAPQPTHPDGGLAQNISRR
jgi:hypothetical protein